MKKSGVINSKLSHVISTMGHGDALCIADAGLPIPDRGNRIDLALKKDIPGFLIVLDTILEELKVESVIIAREMKEKSPRLYGEVLKRFEEEAIEMVSHDAFKKLIITAKGIVRTGEYTPYANMILKSGVVF